MKRTDTPKDGGRALPPGSGNYAENLFVSRVRQALDESANALPQATLARLALARKAALRAQTVPVMRLAPVSALSPAGMSFNGTSPHFGRSSLVFFAILLVGACLAGLYQFEQDRRIEELADVDTAVLNDDLPISAYADHGFNAFIKQNP
jgi:hypothetical protein